METILKGELTMKVKEVWNIAKNFVGKNSPQILTGMAIAGGISAVILTGDATIKAAKIVSAENARRKTETQPEMTRGEMVETCWKLYIPAAFTLASSIVCSIGSCSIATKRNAALAGAYALASEKLKQYQEKTEEIAGKKKASDIRSAVHQEELRSLDNESQPILVTGGGDLLCIDGFTGQRFRSSVDKVKMAIAKANEELYNGGYVSGNDLAYLLGLRDSTLGQEFGWHIEDGIIDVHFDSELGPNDEPALVIEYRTLPRYRHDW